MTDLRTLRYQEPKKVGSVATFIKIHLIQVNKIKVISALMMFETMFASN